MKGPLTITPEDLDELTVEDMRRVGCCGACQGRLVLEGGAVVRPGDKLIVRLTSVAAAEDVSPLAEALPGVEVLVVQAADLLVYRPDEVRASETSDG